jgi:hypothetical protein
MEQCPRLRHFNFPAEVGAGRPAARQGAGALQKRGADKEHLQPCFDQHVLTLPAIHLSPHTAIYLASTYYHICVLMLQAVVIMGVGVFLRLLLLLATCCC